MANKDHSVTKAFITVKDKRKFNWVILALLLIIIVVGVASLIQVL